MLLTGYYSDHPASVPLLMLGLLAQHPLRCCTLYYCPWFCHCHCCICTTTPSTSVLILVLPPRAESALCLLSSCCLVLPTTALQLSYWEVSNWSPNWPPCWARNTHWCWSSLCCWQVLALSDLCTAATTHASQFVAHLSAPSCTVATLLCLSHCCNLLCVVLGLLDAGAWDSEGKIFQIIPKIQKKSTGKGVGSFSLQFLCFLSLKIE